MTARIFHVDMDAFFASVEQRDHGLVGRPVVVAGSGRRGVVAAASYEARDHGIRAGVPVGQAKRLCRQVVIVPPRFDRYEEVSVAVIAALSAFSDQVEPASIDEAFLDMSHVIDQADDPVRQAQIHAKKIRQAVFHATSVNCSVGAASTKLAAKLASGRAKPAGQLVLAAEDELAFLHAHAVGDVTGIGPVTEKALLASGIETVADLAKVSLAELTRKFGKARAAFLHDAARNVDTRAVTGPSAARSVSAERTFEQDIDLDALRPQLAALAETVETRLREINSAGATVTLRVKYPDFTSVSRSKTLREPVSAAPALEEVAFTLAGTLQRRGHVRAAGVSVSSLIEDRHGRWVQDPLNIQQDAARFVAGVRVEHDELGVGVVQRHDDNGVAVAFSRFPGQLVVPATTLQVAPDR